MSLIKNQYLKIHNHVSVFLFLKGDDNDVVIAKESKSDLMFCIKITTLINVIPFIWFGNDICIYNNNFI